MGVHKKEREIEELKEHYIKKTSCIMFVLGALLIGAFIGNTITMLYIGQRGTSQSSSQGAVSQQQPPQSANMGKVAQLEAIATGNPTNADAWIKLGNYCFDNNLPQKAVMAYERAVELSPMKIGVWSDLGVMYRQTSQYNKALEAFRQAAALDSKHITSRFNLGIVYLYDLDDKVNAAKAWKSVLAIDPNAKTPNGQSVAALVKGLEK